MKGAPGGKFNMGKAGTAAQAEYEKWHEKLSVDTETDSPWHNAVKQSLDLAKDIRGKRILEIGCGRGGFACWMARQGVAQEIVAQDFSAVAVAKGESFAAQQGLSGITWQTGDIEAINYPDNCFDTVISCETIEHVPHPRQALRELARVLKPGGRLFLTAPNYMNLMGLYRGYRRLTGRPFTEEGQPINNFLLSPLTRKWLAETGARIIRVESSGYYLPFPGRPPLSLPLQGQPRFIMRWLGLHSFFVAEK
jgi:2-polyprenyl-3-methyl-5-hydroxy-6-metoxy-1,4-benzoquinol methylase